MLWLYRILFLPAFVVLLPVYLRRMLRRGGYRENLSDRFGRARLGEARRDSSKRRVWLQAVSVGEMIAVGPLIAELHRRGVEVYLTATTSTGYQLARARYGGQTIGIGYFPLDWWPFSAATWRQIDPDVAMVAEGERWPEHLHQAARRSVPVVCINARMSDRSFRRLRRWPAAARLVLGNLALVLPSSEQDEGRFRALGVPPDRLTVTGNLKFDVEIPRLAPEQLRQLQAELGLPTGGAIIVGASTWPGEEAALVRALTAVRAAGQPCSLLIVPRHAERREELKAELAGRQHQLARHIRPEDASGEFGHQAGDWRVHFRSAGPAAGQVDIAVADTTGELQRLLQLGSVVFVGKSLPPHTEGQTPVEAAALGKPVLFGPGMSNFRELTRDLLARGAARQVADADQLVAAIGELMQDPAQRDQLAEAAREWHRRNRGAVARTLAVIYSELER
jgi:3-deoxy-D-manno-octulosonic-acid transferase